MNDSIKNEIKKLLYKENPEALISMITKTGMLYIAETEFRGEKTNVLFHIPFEDIGDAKFFSRMDSKLLIRWINTTNKIVDN